MPSPLGQRLAGSVDLGSSEPFHLFAGEAPITTENFLIGATDLQEYQVVALNATNQLVPHDPATDPDAREAKAVGITCYAADASDNAGGRVAVYTGGYFNHEALVWHASLTTLDARKAVFLPGQTIKIGRIIS